MTYEQIIQVLRQFATDHSQIKRFGYGNISDIEVPQTADGKTTDREYPYMFINPGTHQLGTHKVTYNFNIIQMHLASEETPSGKGGMNTVIKAQSDALLILRDLLAYLKDLDNDTIDIIEVGSLNPFMEKYQDTLSGMTLGIQIEAATPLNSCNIPGL